MSDLREKIRAIVDSALASAIPEQWEVAADATDRLLALPPIAEALAGRDAVIEACARAAYGNGHAYVQRAPDGSFEPGSPYDRGRADAVAAIRAMKAAGGDDA